MNQLVDEQRKSTNNGQKDPERREGYEGTGT